MVVVTNKEIGKRIRARRERMDLSQVDVAKMISTNRVTYGRWEAGEQDISVENLQRIAVALEVPMSYLLPGDEDEWAGEGQAAEYFNGLDPEDRPAAIAVLKALRDKARKAEPVIGRKAE